MKLKSLQLVCALAGILSLTGLVNAQGPIQTAGLGTNQTFTYDPPDLDNGLDREVILKVPSSGSNFPAVILLHGTCNSFSDSSTAIDDNYNTDGFVIAMPLGKAMQGGSQLAWNHSPAGRTSNSAGETKLPTQHNTHDDLGFLGNVIKQLKNNSLVNSKKIYVLGGSSGGFMTLSLAAERSDLAGIGVIAASFHNASSTVQQGQGLGNPGAINYAKLFTNSGKTLRVVHVQGECDDKALWGGNIGGTGTNACSNVAADSHVPVWAILDTAGGFVKRNGGAGKSALTHSAGKTWDGVGCETWAANNVSVIRLDGRGHDPNLSDKMAGEFVKLVLGTTALNNISN